MNQDLGNGGAVYVNGGTVQFLHTVFSLNLADDLGGAVYVGRATAVFQFWTVQEGYTIRWIDGNRLEERGNL